VSQQHVYVVAEVTAKKDNADEVWNHIQRLIGPCRSERGNLSYNALRDVDDPAHFLFTEVWESSADFDGHLNSAHLAEHGEATSELIEIPVRITICEAELGA
jgi:quinol monooxygenase YgiN